jgi:hypothetical protein
VNRKLADSHTVEPVLAYTARDSATVAAQLPVFDAADATASRHTSPRLRVITMYPQCSGAAGTSTELREYRDCQ